MLLFLGQVCIMMGTQAIVAVTCPHLLQECIFPWCRPIITLSQIQWYRLLYTIMHNVVIQCCACHYAHEAGILIGHDHVLITGVVMCSLINSSTQH